MQLVRFNAVTEFLEEIKKDAEESKWYKDISRIAVGLFYLLTGLIIMIAGLSISTDILIRDLANATLVRIIVLWVSGVWGIVFVLKGFRRIYN